MVKASTPPEEPNPADAPAEAADVAYRRAEAEYTRARAEYDHAGAEYDRAQAEYARAKDKLRRVQAELDRTWDEWAHAGAEFDRARAEVDRVIAERPAPQEDPADPLAEASALREREPQEARALTMAQAFRCPECKAVVEDEGLCLPCWDRHERERKEVSA